jgi:hypothetical protein
VSTHGVNLGLTGSCYNDCYMLVPSSHSIFFLETKGLHFTVTRVHKLLQPRQEPKPALQSRFGCERVCVFVHMIVTAVTLWM